MSATFPTLVDRNVEFPNRLQLTVVDENALIYDMEMQPGYVTEAGTPVDSDLFTDLQGYIDDKDDELSLALYGTTATAASTVEKAVTCSKAFSYVAGAVITISFTNAHTASTLNLNVNSLGAKAVWIKGSTAFETNRILAGSTHQFIYDGTQFRYLGGDTEPVKSVATYGISAPVTISTTNVTNLTLDTQRSLAGTDLVLASGGIKCLKAGSVSVSGQIFYSAFTSGDLIGCYVKKGSTEESARLLPIAATSGAQSSASKDITVAANDIIYLAFRNATRTGGTVGVDSNGTWLSVHYN